jgi:hypothetical protein
MFDRELDPPLAEIDENATRISARPPMNCDPAGAA